MQINQSEVPSRPLGSSIEKVTDARSRSLYGCSGEHSVLTA
jgi:hypothetical protein